MSEEISPIRELYDTLAAKGPLDEEGKVRFVHMATGQLIAMLYEAFQLAKVENDISLRMEDEVTREKYELSFRKLDPGEEPLPMTVYVVFTLDERCLIVAAVQPEQIAEIVGVGLVAEQHIRLDGVKVRGKPRVVHAISM